MKHYVLSIQQPDGDPPPAEVLDAIMRDGRLVLDEIKAAGAWVFNGALHPPSTATVIKLQDGDLLMTDGPYTEGKEHIGGLLIVKAPDLDVALEWGRRLARGVNLPIQVRRVTGA